MDHRKRAVARAGYTRDFDTARNALKDPDGRVRETALGAVARQGRLAPAELSTALADPDPGVRRRAAELAPTLSWSVTGEPRTTDALESLLDDPDPTVVEMAAWSLGECRPVPPRTVSRLAGVARDHDDALCREAAVAALGAIGDAEGLPTVLAALDDRATVRRRAVIALAPFEGPEVDEALRGALDDRDWQVRQAAEDLLGR